MSKSILIIGESGSGKSTSIKSLTPKETFVINVLDKALPFKSFTKDYKRIASDCSSGNYYSTDDNNKILGLLDILNNKRPDIKNIIIDDFQYIMANDFMRRGLEKGFDKFTQIGQNAWKLILKTSMLRDDINVYILSHSDIDERGVAKCKTIGKMLDDKIVIEGLFTIVLHALKSDGKHKFLTQHNGSYIAKSPMEMFDKELIDNDLSYVNSKINAYFDSGDI